MIPDAAVEAAAKVMQARDSSGEYPLWEYTEDATAILAAAAPHMLSGVISTLNDQVWRLENTLVDECDYPALCAQREALVGVIQMLGTTP